MGLRLDPNAANAFEAWQKRYRDDPVAFVHDCIRWEAGKHPAPYQDDILGMVATERRVAVKGPHGLGKSCLASWVILWRALTWDGWTDWKELTTASAWAQLSQYLWPEVHKWSQQLRWDVIPRPPLLRSRELLEMNLKGKTGEAFAVASSNPGFIEGAHATFLAYVFDEAKIIPEQTYDAAEGAFSTGTCYALAISTPGAPVGRFYDIFTKRERFQQWAVRSVSLDEAISAGRILPSWVEDMRRQWGEDSPIFKQRVMAEFAADNESGVIPLASVEDANLRYTEWQAAGFPGRVTSIGCDVGGGGLHSDKTTIVLIIDGCKVRIAERYKLGDEERATMEAAGKVRALMERYNCPSYTDVIGVGAGVVHRLREQGLAAYGFNAAKKTEYMDQSQQYGYINWRAAGWWILRELLAPGSGVGICLPPDNELTGELTTPKFAITSTSKIQIEDKDSIRALRHGASTDTADAVIQGIVGPALIDEEKRAHSQELEYRGR